MQLGASKVDLVRRVYDSMVNEPDEAVE
jgi:hypothetical protein